jgi:basic membrane lipoprotein Med (substrate-binding protein (PBP1-ABC) superfamily)
MRMLRIIGKTLMIAVALCASVSLVAEGEDKKPSELKIAVLLPSSPTDGGWGQVGATGLKEAAKQFGFKPVIIEAGTADLMKREAESLAQDGYDLIFGHGGQYASPFSEISGTYPKTYFITAGGNITTPNQAVAMFALEQLNYIQGVMAAKLSKTGKLGTVIGGSYPAFAKSSRAFELGAKSVNPKIEVLSGVTQNAADMNEGYELTLAQIKAGADIVWANANQASQGSVKAARETNTYIFGTIMDIQKEAPNQVIATAEQNFNVIYTEVIKRYLAGTLKGEFINIGVPEKGIFWTWNEQVKKKLPADVVKQYDLLLPKIQSGAIHVPGENEGW